MSQYLESMNNSNNNNNNNCKTTNNSRRRKNFTMKRSNKKFSKTHEHSAFYPYTKITFLDIKQNIEKYRSIKHYLKSSMSKINNV